MKFAVATKHMHLVVAYREPDEDEPQFVDNTGGDFEPATGEDGVSDETLKFGFDRG